MQARTLLAILFLLLVVGGATAAATAVVDEPLGTRQTLGVTLWHLGHQATAISQFKDFLVQQGKTPEDLLPPSALVPPTTTTRILLEPELLGTSALNGWTISGNYITSGNGDNGPTVSIPLHVPKAGLYRIWILYYATAGCTGVMSFDIYRSGQESLGRICQSDEIYDQAATTTGAKWHDLLVDLPQGDLVIKIGHVVRWGWYGGGGYDYRKVDCIYLTDELWASSPSSSTRSSIRGSGAPAGIQWTVYPTLTDVTNWKWWQVRPLSWEDSESNPTLFALSRTFQQQTVDALSLMEYSESSPPDYRLPQRQVVYNEIWNMVANPVREKRQIDILNADISRQPLGYEYVWHDVGGNIPGLRQDGNYAGTPYTSYGNWYGGPGCLMASYGNCWGTVTTQVPVAVPGQYAVWVLSSSTNLSYTAPWYGTVKVGGVTQFTYLHQGHIPSVWMKMGNVNVTQPGQVQVDFTLDGAGAGETYRRIYTLFLVNSQSITPNGTVRPPWTMDMYRARAAQAGAQPNDKLLMWITDDPYRVLSQEVWAEQISGGDSWPYTPVSGTTRTKSLLMARDTDRAVQIGIRSLIDAPTTLNVQVGPLTGSGGTFPGKVTWRVEAFIPYGSDRQTWTPFFLMRRPNVTIPPLNVAGVWLNVDTKGVPSGTYQCDVTLSGPDVPTHTVRLNVRVVSFAATPKKPLLLDGWSIPNLGINTDAEDYMRDFVEHGFNVWNDEMSKADMLKWGIKCLHLGCGTTSRLSTVVNRWKYTLGLDYSDYFVNIMDEPTAGTPEGLQPYTDIAEALHYADPNVRVSFNPGEGASLATFQILNPYCDFWIPYSLHVFSPYYDNPQKKLLYQPKPWMWYSTPCLWDKTARASDVRVAPSQMGNCVGVAFFALNYPWRDQWDTGYEAIGDASTMGAVLSRNGPVASIVYEHYREMMQTSQLAMMVREVLGVSRFDDVTDPWMQSLITSGNSEQLISWLETAMQKISDAKTASSGPVNLWGVVVTAAFDDFFYVESDDRTAGMRIDLPGHNIEPGVYVDVTGTPSTNVDGERTLVVASPADVRIGSSGSVAPVGLNNSALGGGGFGYQGPLWQATGLSNVGLLIKTWGRVTYTGSGFFYIDDGSGADDNSGHAGVKVLGTVPTPPGIDPIGKIVIVTGISSCEKPATVPVRLIRTRGSDDVVVVD